MRVFSAICAALILWGAAALAQMQSSIVWDAPQHTAGFPGDIATFTAWYSCTRAYSAAIAATGTQKACDLRRVSDNATCTVLVGTNGNVDYTVGTPCNSNTQTVTAWIGASSARVSKVYDQSSGNACTGSCDVLQATAGNQPLLLLTGCGGSGTLPCIQIGPSQGGAELASVGNTTPSANASISAVANRSAGTQQIELVVPAVARYILAHAANAWDCAGDIAVAADATWHAANCSLITGTGNTLINIDGVDTSGTQSTPSAGKSQILNALGDTSTVLFGEGGFEDNVAWTLGTRVALCHNQRVYYGTGGSC